MRGRRKRGDVLLQGSGRITSSLSSAVVFGIFFVLAAVPLADGARYGDRPGQLRTVIIAYMPCVAAMGTCTVARAFALG
eukprot:1879667-Rhodomonas_salina.1